MTVTRFAPSPTGYLHVGGARTALFSWLMARKAGGKFILRIEDTDLARNTPTAAEQVMKDLKWLGINWDHGPQVGGPDGPYLQSQRRDTYDKYIRQLLDGKKAYYCFDTPEELQVMRDTAAKQKKNFLYPRPSDFPTEEDVKKARADGRPVTIRMAMPQDKPIVVEDIIRGSVSFPLDQLSDFIIQKSDGMPTYHFACVVDDELMGVTHIIRGQEHLMNTPFHQALQDSLGFGRPQYAHISVTVSSGGGKLSKRQRPKALLEVIKSKQDIDIEQLAAAGGISTEDVENFIAGKSIPDMPAIEGMADWLGVELPEINVVDFLRSGYLPEAMVNFLALLGWNPGDDREIMAIDELIEAFDINRLTKSNSLFDRKKLLAFNTEHIRMAGDEKLLAHFKNYLEIAASPLADAEDELLKRIIAVTPGARTLAQIEQKARFICIPQDEIQYDDKAVKKVLLKNNGLAILQTVAGGLASLEEVTPESIEKFLRDLAEEKQVGLGKVAQPLRVAICGNTVSLPIFDAVDILGMAEVQERIKITLGKFN
jgi:glutamyl/glutaminyl-tRNA synthetase